MTNGSDKRLQDLENRVETLERRHGELADRLKYMAADPRGARIEHEIKEFAAHPVRSLIIWTISVIIALGGAGL